MKKRVLFYLTVITSIFSLQSCVTNYVVAEPTVYSKEYKTDAKVTSVDSKTFEQNKQALINSFASERIAKNEKINAIAKNAEIEKAIKLSKTLDNLVQEAYSYLGTPYRYGGMSRSGIDCSAFILSVYGASAGIELPRVAASQSQQGTKVEKSDLQKGDLVFFSHGGRISHVGMVESVSAEGEVKFIHSATSRGVMVSSLTDKYWGPKFRFAKRIITDTPSEVSGQLAHNL